MTPYLTGLLIEAHNESRQEEYDAILYAAWHTAVLTNSGSKIPPLSDLLNRDKGPDPTEVLDGDDEDQIAAKRMMAVMMGATKASSVTRASG